MEPLLFVMAILGCGEGDQACEEVRLAPTRYESQAACLAASEAELARQNDLLFPVVVAQCRRASDRPQPILASQIQRPEPEANRHFALDRRP
jgi:hypothetical protein